jgi:signal transduction histidine kinase
LLLSVLLTIALVLTALTAGFNLVLGARLNSDANSVLSARASAELGALRATRSGIELPEAPDQGSPDTSTWVFQGRRLIERPQSVAVDPAVAAAVAAQAPAGRDVDGGRVRLYSLPVRVHVRRVGAVVVGIALAPYSQTRRTALLASVLLALAAFVAVGLAANWLIRGALAPISKMTRDAAQWSEHDIDRRFGMGPPRDEFTLLAFTLDGLLDRLASSLRHEQRLSAELSHELRTPLANVAAQAQYALRHTEPTSEGRQVLENILLSTQQMTTTLDTLIAAARGGLDLHGATSDANAAVRAVAATCRALADEEGVEIVVSAPPIAPRVAVEQHLVERVLAPLVENGCRHAHGRICLDVHVHASRVEFAVQDDGDGIPTEDLDRIFASGWQGKSGQQGSTQVIGAGLGLALARRLARSAGGEVRAERSNTGARLLVQLPRDGASLT